MIFQRKKKRKERKMEKGMEKMTEDGNVVEKDMVEGWKEGEKVNGKIQTKKSFASTAKKS